MDGTLPRDGELNPDLVGIALGINNPIHFQVPDVVVPRPPSFCKGCSHADMFRALNDCINKYGKGRVFSDIGCYTLGALEPFNSINSCVDMGASVSMAKGAADAGIHPVVAVIGDSTFAHSGITGLLDLVNEKTPVTVIISDNKTTGMTGGQVSSANDRIFGICMGLGVERDHIVNLIPLPKNHSENVRLIQEELEYKGVSVIISERECIQTLKKHHHHLNKE
jgi:indolepyruvate ferredoxin oxidoreductase alpha subunit